MNTAPLFSIPASELTKLASLREALSTPSPNTQRVPGEGAGGEGTQLQETDYSAEERRKMAQSGEAMDDGSFPIRTETDLASAIHLAGHASDPAAARRHIIKRARALGLSSRIPEDWGSHESATDAGLDTPGKVALREHVELIEARAPSLTPAQERENDGGNHSARHAVEVTLIRSGDSKMGNHYPPDVLRAAVPLFDGAPAFADHRKRPDLPEGSVRDVVGHYSAPHYEETTAGQGRIRATLNIIPGNDWLFHLMKEAESAPQLCGLSIDALGEIDDAASSRTRKVVREIWKVSSVDVVTRPSAGGQVERVLHSLTDNPSAPEERTPTMEPQASPAATPDPAAQPPPAAGQLQESHQQPTPQDAGHTNTPTTPAAAPAAAAPQAPSLTSLIEQLTQEREQAQRELQRIASALNPAGAPATADPSTDLSRLVEEIRHERDVAKAESTLRESLTAAALPIPVAAKLQKRFAGKVFDPTHLAEAIDEEKQVLAALSTAGEITGMGYERSLSVGMNEYEQLQAAFDKMFDIQESDAAAAVPRLTGIREAFRIATGVDIGTTGGADRPLRESFAQGLRNYVRSHQLQESEALLREADVTTASFSYLLGTSMNKRLLKDYQAWPSEWQKFTSVVSIKDFKQQDRIRLGAFGSLSTVAEDAQYTTLTVSDTRAIYTPTKRGNLVQVTRETIINDDLYAIKQIPQKLAVAAAFTLAEFVYNLLAPGGGNIYDAHPLFDNVNHKNSGVIVANLGTANQGTALASSALQTAVIAMRKQTNMAGKPIGLKPRYLLVCPDLEFTAMTILRSAGLPGGNNNDINPMMGYAEPIVSPQLNALASGPASTTIAIAVADPRVIDTVEVGFVGGQANPVLLIQDMPLYGLNFTQDTISYKVRHEYGGAVTDYRGFYLINN